MSQDNNTKSDAANSPASAAAEGSTAVDTANASTNASASALTTATTAASSDAASPDTATFEAWVSPGEAAFRRIASLSDSIPESEQERINVVATMVSTTALGAAPRIKAMRAEFVRRVPNHDMTLFDAYEDSALAFEYTDVKVRATKQEKMRLTGRAEALTAVRDRLYEFVEGIAGYGLVNQAALSEVKKEFGYKPMLRDVSTLLEIMGQNWQEVRHTAPFSLEEMSKIAAEVLSLRTALGLQEQAPEGPRQEIVRRRQVYTLFRRCVAEARKVGIYLYGEDAVGEIVPAFFNPHGKPSRNPKPSEELDEDTDVSDTPVAQPNAASKASTQKENAPQRPSGFIVNNPENLPITNPFSDDEDAKESA
jgi:hypothetical protein